MFQAVFGNIILSLAPEIQDIMLQDKPLPERVGRLVDAYFNVFLRHPYLPMFMVREIERDVEHLISTARELQLERYFHKIATSLQEEMDSGKLKKVPMHFIFFTLYGALTFPFLARKLFLALSSNEGEKEDFTGILMEWKSYIIMQMKNLLCYED